MEEAKQKLTENTYNGFWTLLILAIACIVGIIAVVIFKKKLFPNYEYTKGNKVAFVVLLLICIAGHIFCVVNFIPIAKDKKAVDNGHFFTVTGTVIGFDKRSYGENGQWGYSNPIIKIEESEETIVLTMPEGKVRDGNIMIGEIYTFVYLKNTNRAIKVESP